jgi:hypothetical protein
MSATATFALVNFKHELEIDIDDRKAAKKLAKKLRRQARDMMRAHFDYDGIRYELGEIRAEGNEVHGPTVSQAYDLYYDEEADVA